MIAFGYDGYDIGWWNKCEYRFTTSGFFDGITNLASVMWTMPRIGRAIWLGELVVNNYGVAAFTTKC